MTDHAPRPLIEEHYHIRELIDTQQKRADDRTYHQNRAKAATERMDDIKAAAAKQVQPFWCEVCKDDFFAESIKEVESDWTANQYVAFYRTKHWCGKWCIRLITDRHKDAYYSRSRRIAIDRGKHFADLLQPFETNYNLMYGKK